MEVFVSRGPSILGAGAMNKTCLTEVPGHVSPDSYPSTSGDSKVGESETDRIIQ